KSAFSLGDGLWKTGDGMIIDGLGPDGIAATTRELAREASRLQTGYVYHYAFAMLIGVVALVTWYLLPRGAPRTCTTTDTPWKSIILCRGIAAGEWRHEPLAAP